MSLNRKNFLIVFFSLLLIPLTVGGALTVKSLRSKANFDVITPPVATSSALPTETARPTCNICITSGGTIDSCSLSTCTAERMLTTCGNTQYCCEGGFWGTSYGYCAATPSATTVATATASPRPTPAATVTPITSPTPIASLPRTGIRCSINVYKLRETDTNPVSNARAYMTPDRLINPYTYSIKAGDRYIYQMVFTNKSSQNVATTMNVNTTNLFGAKEAIRALGTLNYKCSLNTNKTMSCGIYEMPYMPAYGSYYQTEAGMIVQIQSTITTNRLTNTEFMYTLVNKINPSDYINGSCSVTLSTIASAPTPTAIPTTPPSNCYTIFGRKVCL